MNLSVTYTIENGLDPRWKDIAGFVAGGLSRATALTGYLTFSPKPRFLPVDTFELSYRPYKVPSRIVFSS